MAERWRKGTNDQDDSGSKGGSISQAEADRRSDKGRSSDLSRSDSAPDPEKGDNIMARTPTPAPAPAEKASAQPWNKDGAGAQSTESAGTPTSSDGDEPQDGGSAAGGNGGGTDGTVTQDPATVITDADQVPSSDPADITGDDDDVDIYDTAGQAKALAENDVALTGTKELPSFVRDQVSPSGTDIALEADRSDKPTLERSAYPSLGERLYSMLGKASPEMQQRFEDAMADLATDVIEQLRKDDTSAEFNDRVIDGTTHYGPRVRGDAAKSAANPAGGPTNAELNRRARRAAERVAAAAKHGK